MNILKPELLWIEGRCYRICDQTTDISTTFEEPDLYEDEVLYNQDADVDEEEDFEIELIDDGRYRTSFHVSQHYMGSIIGRKGAIKSKIEHETKTEIKIPRQGQTGDIVIVGSREANVKAARRRINLIVISSRMKQRPTHFLQLPFHTPNIIENFNKFKENILKECSNRGLEERLFQVPERLHLTIGVMCLMDHEERTIATKLLEEAKEKVVMPVLQGHTPFRVRLKGLSYMNDDPSDIHVLYGLVEEENWASAGILQKLADSLVDFFYKAGYMERNEHGRSSVKLHVTLINSKYRSHRSDDVQESKKPREGFDGSGVLDKYFDYDFGVVEVNEIELCQCHSRGSDGKYQRTSFISLDF